MTELTGLIRTERLALIDLLESLTEDQWQTPSWCSAWTVEHVAAHLAWAPVSGPLEMVPAALRAFPDQPPDRRDRGAVDRARPPGDARPASEERRERREVSRWPMTVPVGGDVRTRLRGTRLVALDADWTWGEGAEVREPADVILLRLRPDPVPR